MEERPQNVAIMDVFSKLAQDRIIFIDDEITDDLANEIVAQLLIMNASSDEKITVFINSPGGSVYAGLAIYDIAKFIKCPIETVCIGNASSMGAFLMFMGEKRSATKHARIMFHQPSTRIIGTAEEIEIYNNQMQTLKKELYDIVQEHTTMTNLEELFRVDTWYTAKEALDLGIIHKIL